VDLIMNAARFARIDLDRSRFENERNHYYLDEPPRYWSARSTQPSIPAG